MLEHESVRGVIESMKVVTASNSERVARFAFEYAKRNGRKKVISCNEFFKLANKHMNYLMERYKLVIKSVNVRCHPSASDMQKSTVLINHLNNINELRLVYNRNVEYRHMQICFSVRFKVG